MAKETMESIFSSLPKACVLKTPNAMNNQYQCVFRPNSKHSITVFADTPTKAVVGLAEKLALQRNDFQSPNRKGAFHDPAE